MIGYLDIDNYAATPVKASMSSQSSMSILLWLREGIEEREVVSLEGDEGTALGDGPSIKDAIDDEAKKMVEARLQI